MKKNVYLSVAILLAMFVQTQATNLHSALTANFKTGNPEIQSISSLSFGPEGILFIGDSESAKIFALDTKDNEMNDQSKGIAMKQVDHKIAALLGTTADQIIITDMVANPKSKALYFSVHLQDGTPVLLKTSGETFEHVSLEGVSYSDLDLKNAVKADAKDRRGRSLRKWSISDLAYFDGKVMISGLSNEEFSSTFRSIPFPFKDVQDYSSLEIYHAAHGKYETHSPIKTFMPYKLNGKAHLIASYTCTPLVIFPLAEMKSGEHTKGKTVAELGNRNTPLDIISYQKGDNFYLLLANSSRALMKIDPTKIENYSDFLTEPVKGNSETAGVEFLALPYVNVVQMDKFSDLQIVLLQRMSNGDLNLHSPTTNRL